MDFIYWADLLGTMVFAISGAMAAMRHHIDIFGATFTGFVTAIGGGSLRDMFLNLSPVWVTDMNFLLVILLGVFIAVAFNKTLYQLAKTLLLFDALGIGLFTVVGVQKCLLYDSNGIATVILGMFSAVMGGVIRDTLINEKPLIFRKEVYATACLAGAILFLLLHKSGVNENVNTLLSVSLVVTIRLISVKKGLALPVFGSST